LNVLWLFALDCAEEEDAVAPAVPRLEPQPLQPSVASVERRTSRASSSQYDDVINTVRITAIKNRLRPTIIHAKQQTNSQGKSHRQHYC